MIKELSTKDKIVSVATDLLQRRSYNSISYNDISDEIGIKKASIHYHFQTKDILGIEIIQTFRSKIEYLTTKLDKTESDPIIKLDRYFEHFKRGLEKGKICPGGVFSVEFNTLPVEIQNEVQALFDYYIKWLSSILEEGKSNGSFQFQENSDEKAFYIASVLEGALIFARAYGRVEPYENVVQQLKTQLLV